MNKAIPKSVGSLAVRFSIGSFIGALCFSPFQQIAEILNPEKKQQLTDLSHLDQETRVHCFSIALIFAPLLEESLYRGLIQGHILEKIVTSKLVRILPVACLFASQHNDPEYPFLLGLELGMIKESRLKLAGSIGAHVANNVYALNNIRKL